LFLLVLLDVSAPAPAPAQGGYAQAGYEGGYVYEATLVVQVWSVSEYLGCWDTSSGRIACSDPEILSENTFTYLGHDYRITRLTSRLFHWAIIDPDHPDGYVPYTPRLFEIAFASGTTNRFPSRLTLEVSGRSGVKILTVGQASEYNHTPDFSDGWPTYHWHIPRFEGHWHSGDTVSIKVRAPPIYLTKLPEPVGGNQLRLSYNLELDPATTPDKKAYLLEFLDGTGVHPESIRVSGPHVYLTFEKSWDASSQLTLSYFRLDRDDPDVVPLGTAEGSMPRGFSRFLLETPATGTLDTLLDGIEVDARYAKSPDPESPDPLWLPLPLEPEFSNLFDEFAWSLPERFGGSVRVRVVRRDPGATVTWLDEEDNVLGEGDRLEFQYDQRGRLKVVKARVTKGSASSTYSIKVRDDRVHDIDTEYFLDVSTSDHDIKAEFCPAQDAQRRGPIIDYQINWIEADKPWSQWHQYGGTAWYGGREWDGVSEEYEIERFYITNSMNQPCPPGQLPPALAGEPDEGYFLESSPLTDRACGNGLKSNVEYKVRVRWRSHGGSAFQQSSYQYGEWSHAVVIEAPKQSSPQEAHDPVQGPPLTVSFSGFPAHHDGSPFTFRVSFSEAVTVEPAAMRDHAFEVSGGTVTAAARVDGRSDLWELTLKPSGTGVVSILAPPGRPCGEPGALCTPDGRMLSRGQAYAVPGPPPEQVAPKPSEDRVAPFTASFRAVPKEHDGTMFGIQLHFSDNPSVGARTLKNHALSVTGGAVKTVRRLNRNVAKTVERNRAWSIGIEPNGTGKVTVRLKPTRGACTDTGAICLSDGRKLTRGASAVVHGPAILSVADATAKEGPRAKLAFAVSLSRAVPRTVTVAYATRDGTAKAGKDYRRTRGTLRFRAGQTRKTVSVPILDDAIDEGKETLTLKLTNARGAAIGDGTATGTIKNSDPLQKMWLSRFGRTVADRVTAAVSGRLASPLSGAQVTVGGQTVNLAQTEDHAALNQALTGLARIMGASRSPAPGGGPDDGMGAGNWPGTGLGGSPTLDSAGTPGHVLTGRALLLGSAFHLAAEGDGAGPGLAAWGRVTAGGFDGEASADDGTVRIDGDVITGILGADAAWNRLLAGVAISVSEGEGSFDQPGVDKGAIESTMTTVSPYARMNLNDRLSVWGLAGWGTGDMTIVQAANDRQPERPERTDLGMRLAALGGRGALMQADETGGIDLALRADAFRVETESDPISNEGRTVATASRVRLALEGSRAFRMEGGGVFTPGLELGLRHDGGDTETGTGVELGGRVSYTDPETGLGVEARVRTLVAHEDTDYREWGASGSVRLAPGERGRGLSFSLSPTWGAASSGVERLWSARDARGLAPEGGFEAAQRLEGELGYGLGLFGDRFTGTPNLGFGLSDTARDWRIGWRLTSAVRGDPGFEVNLDATRREAANSDAPAEHGVMLRGAIRW